MVKEHNCIIRISNGTKSVFNYVRDWYDSGRLADGYSWPNEIQPSHETNILSYEKDWSWAGCSGYVTYRMYDTEITFAFSNPASGTNKLGVGTGGKSVWDNMENHDYNQFTVKVDASGGKAILQFDCHCTGGSTNICTVNATAFTK